MIDDELEEDVDAPAPKKHGHFKEKSVVDKECRCNLWIKRCSMCQRIMESDSRVNKFSGDTEKIAYGELDTLVCTPSLARKLKAAKVTQKSKLYWVEFTVDENKILSLRTHENAFKVKGSDTAAALTSSDLCRHILRLPRQVQTTQLSAYVGKNAYDPNRLARLLLKQLAQL